MWMEIHETDNIQSIPLYFERLWQTSNKCTRQVNSYTHTHTHTQTQPYVVFVAGSLIFDVHFNSFYVCVTIFRCDCPFSKMYSTF